VTARHTLAWLAASLAALMLGACASDPNQGYSFQSTYPENVHSVSVPIFDNYTFDTGVETELTDAIIKELQRSTDLRVVQGGNAESQLKGVVTKSELRRLSTQRGSGYVQEESVTLTIDFDWKDTRTGKVLTSRRQFAASDTFVPVPNSGERIDTGRHGAVQRLARDIVSEMRESW
jgi:outer membrane lipopolysaccharide assembly protein LptE/RlpB